MTDAPRPDRTRRRRSCAPTASTSHYVEAGDGRAARAAPRRPRLDRPALGRQPRRLRRPHGRAGRALPGHRPRHPGGGATVARRRTRVVLACSPTTCSRSSTRSDLDRPLLCRVQRRCAPPPPSSASANPDAVRAVVNARRVTTSSTPQRPVVRHRDAPSSAAARKPPTPTPTPPSVALRGTTSMAATFDDVQGRPRRRPGRRPLARATSSRSSTVPPARRATPSTTSAPSPRRPWSSPATATTSARSRRRSTSYRTLPAAELAVLPEPRPPHHAGRRRRRRSSSWSATSRPDRRATPARLERWGRASDTAAPDAVGEVATRAGWLSERLSSISGVAMPELPGLEIVRVPAVGSADPARRRRRLLHVRRAAGRSGVARPPDSGGHRRGVLRELRSARRACAVACPRTMRAPGARSC